MGECGRQTVPAFGATMSFLTTSACQRNSIANIPHRQYTSIANRPQRTTVHTTITYPKHTTISQVLCAQCTHTQHTHTHTRTHAHTSWKQIRAYMSQL